MLHPPFDQVRKGTKHEADKDESGGRIDEIGSDEKSGDTCGKVNVALFGRLEEMGKLVHMTASN
jgi:hypothetical protein